MNDGLSHAVVLSGGSSQGAYHVGVLRALLRGDSPATGYKPLRPDVFSGTSAGAVNAAALLGEIEAGNPDPVQHLEDYWLSRVARTGTSCGNGVYRFRGNPLAFADLGCLITNPLKPAIDLFDRDPTAKPASCRPDRHQFVCRDGPLRKCIVSNQVR